MFDFPRNLSRNYRSLKKRKNDREFRVEKNITQNNETSGFANVYIDCDLITYHIRSRQTIFVYDSYPSGLRTSAYYTYNASVSQSCLHDRVCSARDNNTDPSVQNVIPWTFQNKHRSVFRNDLFFFGGGGLRLKGSTSYDLFLTQN